MQSGRNERILRTSEPELAAADADADATVSNGDNDTAHIEEQGNVTPVSGGVGGGKASAVPVPSPPPPGGGGVGGGGEKKDGVTPVRRQQSEVITASPVVSDTSLDLLQSPMGGSTAGAKRQEVGKVFSRIESDESGGSKVTPVRSVVLTSNSIKGGGAVQPLPSAHAPILGMPAALVPTSFWATPLAPSTVDSSNLPAPILRVTQQQQQQLPARQLGNGEVSRAAEVSSGQQQRNNDGILKSPLHNNNSVTNITFIDSAAAAATSPSRAQSVRQTSLSQRHANGLGVVKGAHNGRAESGGGSSGGGGGPYVISGGPGGGGGGGGGIPGSIITSSALPGAISHASGFNFSSFLPPGAPPPIASNYKVYAAGDLGY